MQELQTSSTVLIDRHNPFQSTVLERFRLNKEGSSKETWHVVLDLKGSNLTYRPGDSIAIYPENHPEHVMRVMDCVGGDELWLRKKANLSRPTKKLIQELATRGAYALKAIVDDHDALTSFIDAHTVPELLEAYNEIALHPEEFTGLVAPLLARFYSIASSQRSVGDEVHCTVAQVRYAVNEKKRSGVCSQFLCIAAQVPIYLQPTKDFTLPEDNHVPIIMIGPGTGIAPFRAFMQERLHRGTSGKNWLFFGERNRDCDFFYEDFWHNLVKSDTLRLEVAFSRDQAEKVYVQHKMWEHRDELWKWLQEGAYVYVCGDASRMAKDVDAMLQKIAGCHMSAEDAKAYVAKLRKDKRYLRDVY